MVPCGMDLDSIDGEGLETALGMRLRGNSYPLLWWNRGCCEREGCGRFSEGEMVDILPHL